MDYCQKKVTIMGLGLFGGGLGVTKYFVQKNAKVLVTDLRSKEDLRESLAELENLPIQLRLGEHCEEDFTSADIVIVNPGVPETSRYLQLARESGAIIDTEINIFLRECKAKIIGITGSNGKSTTTGMIHHIFEKSGIPTWLGGNIGRSLLAELPNIKENDVVVLELSSFQLERAQDCSPQIAVVTNVSRNHLDRHKTMENYAWAKQNLIRFQKPSDHCILNITLKDWENIGQGQKYYFGNHGNIQMQENKIVFQKNGIFQPLINTDELLVRGKVNIENAMAAAMACLSWGLSVEQIAQGLRTFQGLPHRLEYIGTFQDRKIYEDSDATTPESTMAALEAFTEPIILIAGGGDKDFDYTELGKCISQRVKALILMGETAPKMQKVVQNIPIHIVANMKDAVQMAKTLSEKNNVILLSPAATSFGLFRNFVERAEVFKKCVYEIFD
ncbi:MAG: UDP-N-acetylmuramoyl-L-alanine--D-glutamate ligase [Planctomycetes bacterium]|nr:UDP-N-acetylmuramoyl-L-alanine--D-glutamate ligase [Planctomycetota bacterium]HON44069.1 UDP-N-acetylmuramoyl-L-alanine--D-glutamate ligase [Planctomycetota bacterium]HPY75446.1 UDP-N-acetylmuramoyl-L-alanine--D-glutamate ligase [Planctomycetota bacterium]HQB00846.1 UDP-N-acetylmuramoyl-L-alanine--D-glutamate ligase [Planctomycetota bacterium]HRU52108.1 UDP-N-acetylmuramoyl-L-alanine--D-glutamate ligase [Planctomycetota bacterium]